MGMAAYSIVRARGGRATLALLATLDDPPRRPAFSRPGAGDPVRSPDEPPASER